MTATVILRDRASAARGRNGSDWAARSLAIRDDKTSSKSHDLTTSIFTRMKKLISRGGFRPEYRLPPERELARKFGVNRCSLRNALKALVLIGVLDQRVGDGTYVTAAARSILAAPLKFYSVPSDISFEELFETRRVVEPELAVRAAIRRTEVDLARLESAIAAMGKSISSGSMSGATKHDLTFHRLLWKAAGDRVICRMLEPLHVIAAHSIELVLSLADHNRARDHYQSLLDAVRSKDPEAAGHAMEVYLETRVRAIRASSVWREGALILNSSPLKRARSEATKFPAPRRDRRVCAISRASGKGVLNLR